jgi:ABC-type polysaccharide/polyol phosphate transport system ATPase subunit
MSDPAIEANELGKMYRLYRRPADRVLDALGVDRLLFWRRRSYSEFWAVRGLRIEVGRGERVGIIGPNGAGKSTLLKILCGNVRPSEGSYRVRGQVQALMSLGTGFHPEFTGRQNIRASLAYHGLPRRIVSFKEEEIVDFAELEDFIDQPVKTYSAGMYARLAFATATAIEPEILMIDEILGAGDAYFTGKCVERMKGITEDNGATVLFVSHDLSSVQRLCTRLIWMERGRIRMEGPTPDVLPAYLDHVRAEENVRHRAEEMHLGRRQARSLAARDDAAATEIIAPADATRRQDASPETACRIVSVDFEVPGRGSTRVVTLGEELLMHVGYQSKQDVLDPVFGVTFHRIDGLQMDHQNSKLLYGDVGRVSGRGTATFRFAPLRLGIGEYSVSVEILKGLNLEHWHEPLAVHDIHDRRYRLSVFPPSPEYKNRGAVVQECEFTLSPDDRARMPARNAS